MQILPEKRDVGVNVIAENLHATLQGYIEAQYHIRNENLIDERRALLDHVSTIHQAPYIEATPVYEMGCEYQRLQIPDTAKDVLVELAALEEPRVLPRTPYVHQGEALEAFLGRDADIVVATGTGSGKTECFLMPLIGALALEAHERPETAALQGCRAILLYPMNALVNDQLSRIRKLFGRPDTTEILSRRRGRPVRFATYTGRTPYPGRRSAAKDSRFVCPLFEEYYLKLLDEHPDVVLELDRKGRWPSKDLRAFYRDDLVRHEVYRSGKRVGRPRTVYNWKDRLRTGESDRELMMRQEVQEWCPDLLVTNYSMLEYMLMRPIERSIFTKTREWLASDELKNELMLVVDEAHLYNGAAGAEVALLIRRLAARLEIPRERLRCILTSASLGDPTVAAAFARDLTGLGDRSARRIEVIAGTLETRSPARSGDSATCAALCAVDLAALERFAIDESGARGEVDALAARLHWLPAGSATAVASLREYLFTQLTGFGPAEKLIQSVSGKAIELGTLATDLFSESPSEEALAATAVLLSLCTLARRDSDDRVLLPARLHLFFRGLPGLYACCDPNCSAKRAASSDAVLGRLYTEPRLHCVCSRAARVFELLTHRDCGTAFLRCYISGPNGAFLWDFPSQPVDNREAASILPIELLVERQPHPDDSHNCREGWLDLATGRIQWSRPLTLDGFRKVYAPGSPEPRRENGFAFPHCPVCLKSWQADASKIMDHYTKGEEPFAALVTTQLRDQPAQKNISTLFPNAGRKVLLFSDGRQKAARLARDIPRAVEQDVFREALASAVKRLNGINREAQPNNHLYVAFVATLAEHNILLFDGADYEQLERDVRTYRDEYGDDFVGALADLSSDLQPPRRYNRALLQQLCSRFYSLVDLTIGFVRPSSSALSQLVTRFKVSAPDLDSAHVLALAVAWIGAALDNFAFNVNIDDNVREQAARFQRAPWGSTGAYSSRFRKALLDKIGWDESTLKLTEHALASTLADDKGNEEYYLQPRKLQLDIDLAQNWYRCVHCTRLSPVAFGTRCIHCGDSELEELEPRVSRYIRARKGYWRDPVAAVLNGTRPLETVSVEEHTAQLSHRDKSSAHSTTERYELRFQDILIDRQDAPIDVLSCTTTMEVGIDIGDLVAIGLRNIPPQRSNYQQRAGRAGRRGSAVSTVVTYAQSSPHDSFYFHNPQHIIAGPLRTPDIKIDNQKIAWRHINAFLFQTFFNEAMDRGDLIPNGDTSSLEKSLGRTDAFFHGIGENGINLTGFSAWVHDHVIRGDADLKQRILSWLPESLLLDVGSRETWIELGASRLLERLEALKGAVPPPVLARPANDGVAEPEPADDLDSDTASLLRRDELLEFLFEENLLPTYAFPTKLAGFLIEEQVRRNEWLDVRVKELPQQSMDKALSEYAPGRLVVVNKQTYRSGGVTASTAPTERDRARPLFEKQQELVYCTTCTYVRQHDPGNDSGTCPVCRNPLSVHWTIQPDLFTPERGRALTEDDRDQEITYATMAQFPVPVGDQLEQFTSLGPHVKYTHSLDRLLITTNKGRRVNGEYSGFSVCQKCGAASPEEDIVPPHPRPYLLPHPYGKSPRNCDGQARRVYLGTLFRTDVLLLRFHLATPLICDTHDTKTLRILEDALYTVAEAISLTAAQHPALDLDPKEIGSGFRIVPGSTPGENMLDVYLYDTSAGGAGYSELVARHIDDISRKAISRLEACPGRCDRSCQECLRHFYNQHFQDRLDRYLGAGFLRHVIDGSIPPLPALEVDVRGLTPLKRYLDLEGYACELGADRAGSRIPLLVSSKKAMLAIGSHSALIDENAVPNSGWEGAAREAGLGIIKVNDYDLKHNLPILHQKIARFL